MKCFKGIIISNFSDVEPEFGCYIVFIQSNGKKYFFDYINKKFYDLDNKNNDSFIGKKLLGIGNFYSIMFLNSDIKIWINIYIINIINKKQFVYQLNIINFFI